MTTESQSSESEQVPVHQGCCDAEDTQPVKAGIFQWLSPRPTRRRFIGLMAAGVATASQMVEAAVKDAGPCGAPPPPKPAQASGAEGVPPLPLPAVPLRRTEKKNPPKPPTIIVKIQTGQTHDWGTDLNDVNNLLGWMQTTLKVNFSHVEKPLDQVDLEAGDVPVLYRTGHHAFSFTEQQRERLRRYLTWGGMIIFDSCCGRKEFADSARQEIAAIFPDRKLKRIPLDHPVFNSYYENAGWTRFTPASSMSSPAHCELEGIEIGCRMAVVFSPHDMSCGWDMHTHSTPECTWIESEDALKLGANLMAYATATRDMGVSLADSKAYKDAEPTKTDKFRIGQIVHEGDWNPDAVGLRNLLDTVGAETALKVSFDVLPVQLADDQLSQAPFLYMTGHEDFKWTDAQAATLRAYLHNGGFLLADSCCGRKTFDLAFRREMAKVLKSDANPGGEMKPLPVTHAVYSSLHQVKKVQLTEAAAYKNSGQASDSPRLEGAYLDGRVAVIYSPLGLNVGWRLKKIPYAVGYGPRSALDLGVNVVMLYALGA